jgi:hypothetical protein
MWTENQALEARAFFLFDMQKYIDGMPICMFCGLRIDKNELYYMIIHHVIHYECAKKLFGDEF